MNITYSRSCGNVISQVCLSMLKMCVDLILARANMLSWELEIYRTSCLLVCMQGGKIMIGFLNFCMLWITVSCGLNLYCVFYTAYLSEAMKLTPSEQVRLRCLSSLKP